MNRRVDKKKRRKSGNINLREMMLNRLKSARLRYINDAMYNNEKGKKILLDKHTFKTYHDTLKDQQQLWSTNPLDIVIKDLREMLKSFKGTDFSVADFGCGTARIALELQETQATVYSFDLVALSDKVTVCDMSKTPLPSSSVDVVVNCLSLMSSDCTAYIDEGWRVLKDKGVMLIVEVTSRLSNEKSFVQTMKEHGLVLLKKSLLSDEYFSYFNFVKSGKKKQKADNVILGVCKYKKR